MKSFVSMLENARAQMVEIQLRRRGIQDERVLAAMARVPRHQFVDSEFRAQAYEDNPLPLREGQTISQPYIVALMLESLRLQPYHTVLEIGTGSGYQAALLAELASHVYSIERHAALARDAKEVLAQLGYDNITLFVGDGSQGLPATAPYDAIVVSAAAPEVPRPLFEQLRNRGRLVLPVGPAGAQELELVENADGVPLTSFLSGCRFVPLIGQEGYGPED